MGHERPTEHGARADALAALVPSLRMFANALCCRRNVADDLVHETLLEGVLRIERRDLAVPLRDWLFTIMRNAFYTGVHLSDAPEEAARGRPQDLPGLSAQQRAAARAVFALPPPEREAVVLVAILGMSHGEAARIGGCTPAAIARRLERARRKLCAGMIGERGLRLLRPG